MAGAAQGSRGKLTWAGRAWAGGWLAHDRVDDGAVADARAMGLGEDEIGALALGEDDAGIWTENVAAVEAFLSVSTQWRVAMGQSGMIVLGLDYTAARAGLDLAGTAVSPDLWGRIQVIESGALQALNGRSS